MSCLGRATALSRVPWSSMPVLRFHSAAVFLALTGPMSPIGRVTHCPWSSGDSMRSWMNCWSGVCVAWRMASVLTVWEP